MLDFNAGEILLLVVLAVIIFGPEKLPELARKAARVVNYLRRVANDARGQLREQIPELGDLELTDLNPRALGVKLLGAATVDDLSETGRSAAREVGAATAQAAEAGRTVTQQATASVPETALARPVAVTTSAEPRTVAFDPEAT